MILRVAIESAWSNVTAGACVVSLLTEDRFIKRSGIKQTARRVAGSNSVRVYLFCYVHLTVLQYIFYENIQRTDVRFLRLVFICR